MIDKVALHLSVKTDEQVWFSNLDSKNTYSQLQLCKQTSKQCNFSIIGGETIGFYRFSNGFYGLVDMPNEFQRVIDSILKGITYLKFYLDDIFIASKGTVEELKAIVQRILETLDKNIMALKWGNCAFFKKEIEWHGFKISEAGVRPLVRLLGFKISEAGVTLTFLPSGTSNSSDLVGQASTDSSLVSFNFGVFAAMIFCFAKSVKNCNFSHVRSENCILNCILLDNSSHFNYKRISFSDQALL